MTWKELTLKERASMYRQARAISPDLTYFDIRDLFDSIPEKIIMYLPIVLVALWMPLLLHLVCLK